MKVYVVTTGEYSDYTIRGIFSTRKAAEDAIAAMKVYPPAYCCEPNPIEEYELDEYKPFEKYLTLHYAPKSGEISGVHYEDYARPEWIAPTDDPNDIYMVLQYNERFTDKDVLKKAVQDKYMKWKAEQEDIV